FLAFHHACAGTLTQFLDHLGSDIHRLNLTSLARLVMSREKKDGMSGSRIASKSCAGVRRLQVRAIMALQHLVSLRPTTRVGEGTTGCLQIQKAAV
ncbi:MAG TPA: hypothetical protein VFN25_14120, partial [Dokdonella sp.]|uniref:hypothetical protein n=1 Tax=Dokdonella sp. TaxID=2291710 RepID=UPI002D7E9476